MVQLAIQSSMTQTIAYERGLDPEGFRPGVEQSGHEIDTTATKPLHNGCFVTSDDGDAEQKLNTPGHSTDSNLHAKCATGVLRECADPDLARLIEAWPTLSDEARTDILRIGGIR